MARHHLIALTLVLITAAVFAEVRCMEFVDWDDHINVFDNPFLNPVTTEGLVHFWKAPYFTSYIPVTRTVWAALAHFARVPPDAKGISLDPAYFHVANLVVHVLNVLLVFAILRMLVRTDWPAAAGAALFALHPVQVEPVAWVTGMKDLLGGMFALIALQQYLAYAAATRDDPEARRRVHYAVAIVAFALGVLSKHTIVALPLMAWALDRWALGREARECTWALAGWLPVAVAGIAVAKLTQGTNPEAALIWVRCLAAGDALAFYLWKLLVPVRLGLNYGRTPEHVMAHAWGYLTWLVPCALGALVWLKRRSWPVILASAAVFIAGLLPLLGLVPFRFQQYSTVADRYLYLAMLGPALALAWALSRVNSKAVAGVCVAGLVTLACLSVFQSLHWYNTLTLFAHTLEVNPRSAVFHNAIGVALAAHGRPQQSYLHYQAALKLDPNLADAHYNLGMGLFSAGEPEQAIEHYEQALRLKPDADTYYNMGMALAALDRDQEAASHFREALRLKPWAWDAHTALAQVLHRQGKDAEAEAHYLEAIRIRPDFAEAHYGLGELYTDTGRTEEAAKALAVADALRSGSAARPARSH